ncbi:hypothetical protein HHK36_001151 [Tetracentron sinense]|uniref:Uncharacterized protein n=1 Tax=Tetracentron sinense TaxID=13715 RepID=A0A834ZWS6_TETSI|nr:hypothetical protein HHK36_001151 [Tetracentron sinense]
MANEPRTLKIRSSEDQGDIEELEKLEVEVNQMAQTILHHRATLPDHFQKTFTSVLAAQRPVIPHFDDIADPGISQHRNPDAGEHVESPKGSFLAEDDPESAEKKHLLKLKLSSNVSAMPTILKRMNEWVSMFDKLDAYSGITHPSFKRKRTS